MMVTLRAFAIMETIEEFLTHLLNIASGASLGIVFLFVVGRL